MPVPEPLARAVDRCLAKCPDDRWPSLEAFADALAGEATAAPQTPAAVRIWMADQSWLASVDMLLIMMGFSASLVDRSLGPMALGALAPVLVHATARLLRTRTLLGDGYSLADIRRALAQRLRERDEEVAYNSRRTRWGDRFVRLIAGASTVATAAAATIVGVIMYDGHGSPPDWLAGTLVGGFLSSAISLRVMFSDPASRFRLRDMSLRAREWLWRGAGGEWMTRVAGWRLRRSMDAAALRDRPTEVALGIAAEDLYRALSAETRKALGDLPAMLRELEAEASRARAELAHAVGDDANRHRERLQGLVAALESVRLDLLKLTAGTGTLHAVTAAMGVAARLADATDRGVGARDETRRLVGGVDASLLSTPV